MSQNLRVALWVPQVDPAQVGNNIRTLAPPTANKRVPSEFAAITLPTLFFASQPEVTVGTVADKAISPLTLRTDNARMLDIPAAAFTGIVSVVVSAGAASANKLIKTNASGVLDDTLFVLDGGTF